MDVVLVGSSDENSLENLECPVCFDIIYPPIIQCSNGHTLCSDCKPKVKNTCPICKITLGDIRALALERFVAYIFFPCSYRSNGCRETVRYDAKKQHEKECSFRPYNCPYPCSKCEFEGNIPTLVSHLQEIHESSFEYSCVINTLCHHKDPYNGKDASSNIKVYKYLDNHYFCLHFEAFYAPQDLVYMAFLTFMGEDLEAMNYRYKLEIGNSSRKMTWEEVPRSIRVNKEDIKENSDSLIIHQNIAQNFSETNSAEELALRVKGLIWIAGGNDDWLS